MVYYEKRFTKTVEYAIGFRIVNNGFPFLWG